MQFINNTKRRSRRPRRRSPQQEGELYPSVSIGWPAEGNPSQVGRLMEGDVDIGLLTAPFGDKSLEWVAEFADKHGFAALEVAVGPGGPHLDLENFNSARASEVQQLLARIRVRISSLAFYVNLLDPDSSKRTQLTALMKSAIDAAHALEVGVVCTLAGMPSPGKDRAATIAEDFPPIFEPLVEYAAQRNIKLAFENWFATNFMNLAHWRQAFEAVPADNLGLNFDPSHLLWQGIDYLAAVEQFKERIFHVHAKDTEVKPHVLRVVGNQSGGWWRYCTPGYGSVDWPAFIARLRQVGYDDVLSIENEDGVFPVEEGFIKGRRHLSQYV